MNIIPAVLGRTINEVMEQTHYLAGATLVIHLDVMDGQFVPEVTPLELGPLMTDEFAYDLHLMVVDPEQFMPVLHRNQIRRVFVHAELSEHTLHRFFEMAHEVPLSSGLALNPGTTLDMIAKYRDHIDSILLMSVAPGAAGQAFDGNVIDRLHQARQLFNGLQIYIDGGINEKTISNIKTADGAVAHSAIFGHAETPSERIAMLEKIAAD